MRLCAVFSAAALGALLLAIPERLVACAFDTVLPRATLSGQIAGSIELIAARPSTADPFRFEAVAVLSGVASGNGPPHLVDSAMRARLARDPEQAVLFAHQVDGSWTRLLVIDDATRPVIAHMIARADFWGTPEGAADRRDYFAALLAHPDEQLRRSALQELDALPYGVLRSGVYPVPSVALLRGLASIEDMPFAPIRILLLGIDQQSTARAAVSARLEWLAASGTDTHLGAWITAAIESGGPTGIADLERLFFAPPARLAQAQLTEIVRALSVQSAAGDPALRSDLDRSIRRLVTLYPEAAPQVAQVFGAAGDFTQTELIRELMAAGAFTGFRDLTLARAYLAGVRPAVEPRSFSQH